MALSRRRVLVTDWVDGLGFDDVGREPDAVRDRYAEIVYRFFYGTALELGLALGDPHPGNYLLCPDGRVAFFDFGMVRPLPRDYVRREGVITRAVRDGVAADVLAGLHTLGYLPGEPADWDEQLLLDYMRAASWWLEDDAPLRLGPEDVWRSAEVFHQDDGPDHVAQLRKMTLPREALLLRRMDGLLFQTAATLRASAPWGGLLREITGEGEPVGVLGAEHAAWLVLRHPRRGTTDSSLAA